MYGEKKNHYIDLHYMFGKESVKKDTGEVCLMVGSVATLNTWENVDSENRHLNGSVLFKINGEGWRSHKFFRIKFFRIKFFRINSWKHIFFCSFFFGRYL